jgi:large subunit ribosomal protein L38
MIANHYGLFDDLFKHGYFIPRIPLHVNYPYNNDQVTPVYSGNRLYAKDVKLII